MSVAIATGIVVLLGVYLGVGALFALAFHLRGLSRIDASAAHGSLGFRIVVTPGVVALWPLLARRWWRGGGAPPEEHNAHRDAASP